MTEGQESFLSAVAFTWLTETVCNTKLTEKLTTVRIRGYINGPLAFTRVFILSGSANNLCPMSNAMNNVIF
jgi:hypothetical protein